MDKPGASSFWAPGFNMDMNKPEQFLYEFCRGSLLTKYVKLLLQPRQKEKNLINWEEVHPIAITKNS